MKKKTITFLFILFVWVCIGITGCGLKNNTNLMKECFEKMEKTIEDGLYKIEVVHFTDGREKLVGVFDMMSEEDGAYIGFEQGETVEERYEDFVYSYLYHYNNIDYNGEIFHYNVNREIHYEYAGDVWGYENYANFLSATENNYMNSIASKNLSKMIKNGFESDLLENESIDSTLLTPDYDVIKNSVLTLLEDAPAFVKSKEIEKEVCKISVQAKDYLRWCDDNETNYDISTEMFYVLDSYPDDMVLEIGFDLTEDNVEKFEIVLISEQMGMKEGFRWNFKELGNSPKKIYENIVEQMKPANYMVALDHKMNELDAYYKATCPNDIILYTVEKDSSYTGQLVVMKISEDNYELLYFIYNEYDYTQADVLDGIEVSVENFYERQMWNGGELVQDNRESWKGKLLAELLYYANTNVKGNFIYLNDDSIPEIVIMDDGGLRRGDEKLFIVGYIDDTRVNYEFTGELSSENIIYVQSKEMRLCTYDDYASRYNTDQIIYIQRTLNTDGTYERELYLSKDKVDRASTADIEYEYYIMEEGGTTERISENVYEEYVNVYENTFDKIVVNQLSIQEMIDQLFKNS